MKGLTPEACRPGSGQHFDLLPDHITIHPMRLDPIRDRLQAGLQQRMLIGDHDAANHGLLPMILQVHFRNREVEFTPQPRHERFDNAAFLLEGAAARQVQVDGQGGDHGG